MFAPYGSVTSVDYVGYAFGEQGDSTHFVMQTVSSAPTEVRYLDGLKAILFNKLVFNPVDIFLMLYSVLETRAQKN